MSQVAIRLPIPGPATRISIVAMATRFSTSTLDGACDAVQALIDGDRWIQGVDQASETSRLANDLRLDVDLLLRDPSRDDVADRATAAVRRLARLHNRDAAWGLTTPGDIDVSALAMPDHAEAMLAARLVDFD